MTRPHGVRPYHGWSGPKTSLTPRDRLAARRTVALSLLLAAVAALVMAQTDEPGSTLADRLARLGALSPVLGAIAAGLTAAHERRRGESLALALSGASPLRQSLGPALGGALVGSLGAGLVLASPSLRSLLPALPTSPWRMDGASFVAPALGLRLDMPGGSLQFVEPLVAGAAGHEAASPRPFVLAALVLGAVLAPWWAATPASVRSRAVIGALALLGSLGSFQAVAAGAPAVTLLVPPLVPGGWLLVQALRERGLSRGWPRSGELSSASVRTTARNTVAGAFGCIVRPRRRACVAPSDGEMFMNNRIAAVSLGVLTACALAVTGCKKDDPPANSANNVQPYGTNGAYGQPAYGQPAYGQPTAGQPAYGQPTTGYPPAGTAPAATTAAPANNPLGALGAMFPGMGGTAPAGTAAGGTTAGGQEVANNTSMGAAGAAFLTPLQQQNAPGSRQVGETLAGNLSQGQLIKTSVQLQPGKCYTGIGQGSGGPVVVELVAQVGGMVLAAGQPALISVLGAGANCYKNPLPLAAPVFFRVTAQGTGPVTAALYEK